MKTCVPIEGLHLFIFVFKNKNIFIWIEIWEAMVILRRKRVDLGEDHSDLCRT